MQLIYLNTLTSLSSKRQHEAISEQRSRLCKLQCPFLGFKAPDRDNEHLAKRMQLRAKITMRSGTCELPDIDCVGYDRRSLDPEVGYPIGARPRDARKRRAKALHAIRDRVLIALDKAIQQAVAKRQMSRAVIEHDDGSSNVPRETHALEGMTIEACIDKHSIYPAFGNFFK